MTSGLPCIICGAPRSQVRGVIHHDVEPHEEYRREYERWMNLLRPRAPALRGLQAVLDYYGVQPPKVRDGIEWGCKVLKGGEVIHRRVERPAELKR
jgi:hypothetical protein